MKINEESEGDKNITNNKHEYEQSELARISIVIAHDLSIARERLFKRCVNILKEGSSPNRVGEFHSF